MAPELLENLPYTSKVDIWYMNNYDRALGCIYY